MEPNDTVETVEIEELAPMDMAAATQAGDTGDATAEAVAQAEETEAQTEEAEAQTEEAEEVDIPTPPLEPAPNVDVDLPVSVQAVDSNRIAIPFIQETVEAYNRILGALPEDLSKAKISRVWLQTVSDAESSYVQGTTFEKRIEETEAHWRQHVEHDGIKLRAGKPRIGNNKSDPSQLLSGDNAIMKIRSVLGMGSGIQIPLWHSGIWLLLKTPSDSDLLLLERKIASEKIQLGMQTNGLVYSNMSAYMTNLIVTFILDHVIESTVKDSSTEKLLNLIRATDIPLLIHGICSTIYPNGYPFAFPCVSKINSCQYVNRTVLSIPRLLFVDNNALTKEQKRHMLDRNASYTEQQILDYQSHGDRADLKSFEINDKLRIVLKVPTIREYIVSGYKWVADIEQSIDDSMRQQMSDNDRNGYINAQALLASMREYSHWVARVVVSEETNDGLRESIVEDTDTIDDLMATFSSDSTIIETFSRSVSDYIREASMAIIAIPKVNCPSCGAPMSEEYKRHPQLSILNIEHVFFILRLQRLSRIGGLE